ncbi:MAG: hypothetical protein LBR82_00215 [Desulfovibrio sp.]|jgi:hypothetical protein|nr:hypothetical protein [Desulfovibrio sp.]
MAKRQEKKKGHEQKVDHRVTKEKLKIFLDTLSECGSIRRGSAASGISRKTLYKKREREPLFAADWDKAAAIGVEGLEDEARRRAFEGWEEPVYHKGEVCGTVRKYSDTLLIVLLKGHKPEKYRENSKVALTGADEGPLRTEIIFSDALQALIDKATGRENAG